jgi:VWFA-related protein
MRTSSVVVGLVVAVVLVATPAAQQTPQPAPPQKPVARFETRVDLVTVDVSVLDGDRRPVRGLTAADFTILENGKPQEIQAFSAVDLPDVEVASAPWIRDVAPDVTRNDDLADRRIVAIVLDDALPMSVGGLTGNLITYVKKMASEVVNQLGPRDLAAVIFPLQKSNGQDFTSDRARLLKAINRYTGNLADRAMEHLGIMDAPGIIATRREFLYRSLLSTVRMLTENLTELPQRRKALILVSEGIPLDIEEMFPQIALSSGSGAVSQPALVSELHDTFVAAQRANVSIYPIDPGGLRVTQSITVDFLKGLATATGGYAVVDTNDTATGIRQIFRENSSYYLLGYAAPDPKMEGRFRKIQVKVNKPGLTVRARTGYFERGRPKPPSKKAPPAPVWKALGSPMPKGDVVMHATAAPFAVPGRSQGAVAIVVALHQPAPPGADRVVEDADLLVNAYDPKGDRRGIERLSARVILKPERAAEVRYELFSRLDLPPGRYQIRLAASSSMQGKSGSVFVDVDVPDFSKAALSMSGALLSAAAGPTSAPKDKLASLVPVVPTTRREFSGGDRIEAFARIYQGGRKALATVTVSSRIVDGLGATVFDTTETFGPDRFATDRAAEYRLDLPIERLAPGMYLLVVDAKTRTASSRRDVRFMVR